MHVVQTDGFLPTTSNQLVMAHSTAQTQTAKHPLQPQQPAPSLSILVLCPHYLPDTAPTGQVMSSLCERWTALGHRVEIITSLPWYKDHVVAQDWQGQMLHTQPEVWGRIRRWYPFAGNKAGLWRRALGFVGFSVLVGIDAVRAARRCDVVFAMSPPLTLGAAGWFAAAFGKNPLVFNVQDIFPEAAVRAGVLRNKTVIALASGLERWLYRRAAAVTVLSQDMAHNVQAKCKSAARVACQGAAQDAVAEVVEDQDVCKQDVCKQDVCKQDAYKGVRGELVVVIPNCADASSITPAPTQNTYREDLGLPEENSPTRVVMYAGNLGHSQPLELVVGAAERFSSQGHTHVHFVINGDGVARPQISQAAQRLSNLHLLGWQPSERLSEVLAAADVHLVLLRSGLASSSVPSKLYSVLAAGRPVLASVDQGSEVERLLAASGAGISVPPDNLDMFCEALEQMLANPKSLREMGQRARTYAEATASPAQIADKYLQLFDRVLNR